MSYRLLRAGRLAGAAAPVWSPRNGQLGTLCCVPDRAIQLGQLLEGELNVLLALLARQLAVGRELQDALEHAACLRAIAGLARKTGEAGDGTEARRMLQRVLELAPDGKLSRQDREEYIQFALEELAELDGAAAGKPRRTEMAFATAPDRRSSAGQPSSPQQPVRHTGKVGRNDPCPCGSGKKYKKCCGG